MITEVNRLCSDQQLLPSGTTASEGILDNVRQAPVADGRLHFIVQITNPEEVNGRGGNLTFKIQTSPDNSAWTDLETGEQPLKDLIDDHPDAVLFDKVLTDDVRVQRYLRVQYTSGYDGVKVTAGEFTEGAPRYRRIFEPGAGFTA